MMTYIGIIEKEESIVSHIRTYLVDVKGCRVAFSCTSFKEYQLLPEGTRKADILFMGVVNEMEGLKIAGKIKRASPDVQVVVMHMTKKEQFILNAVRAGVVGFLGIPFRRDLFEECLLAIKAGNAFLCTEMQRKLFNLLFKENPVHGIAVASAALTERESAIVRLLLKGYTNKEIGDYLFISHHTVNEHLKRVFRKLNVNSRVKLINKVVAELNLQD